jgi:hypothetical protein
MVWIGSFASCHRIPTTHPLRQSVPRRLPSITLSTSKQSCDRAFPEHRVRGGTATCVFWCSSAPRMLRRHCLDRPDIFRAVVLGNRAYCDFPPRPAPPTLSCAPPPSTTPDLSHPVGPVCTFSLSPAGRAHSDEAVSLGTRHHDPRHPLLPQHPPGAFESFLSICVHSGHGTCAALSGTIASRALVPPTPIPSSGGRQRWTRRMPSSTPG